MINTVYSHEIAQSDFFLAPLFYSSSLSPQPKNRHRRQLQIIILKQFIFTAEDINSPICPLSSVKTKISSESPVHYPDLQ